MSSSKITYQFPKFALEFDPQTGSAMTYYTKEHVSGCPPVDDDAYHASLLGISPAYHRLCHELAHHLIGIYVLKAETSFVVSMDAMCNVYTGHGLVLEELPPGQQEKAKYEEWLVTALTYLAFDKLEVLVERHPEGNYEKALVEIECHANAEHLAQILDWLLAAPIGGKLDLREAVW